MQYNTTQIYIAPMVACESKALLGSEPTEPCCVVCTIDGMEQCGL